MKFANKELIQLLHITFVSGLVQQNQTKVAMPPVNPFTLYAVSKIAWKSPFWHMPSGRRHGILNLLPSLIVFCPYLNQLEGIVGVFTTLPSLPTQDSPISFESIQYENVGIDIIVKKKKKKKNDHVLISQQPVTYWYLQVHN